MGGHRSDVDVTNRRNLLHKEPAVIDEDMISDALKKALPRGSESKYARELGIDPKKAEVLAIEFQSISQIANISHMVLLKKLALSNNVITRIEGLSKLVNLEELDLSFNSIKKIEGLDHLPKLKIVNFHRNLITKIENLDKALRLEVVVLSTNGIRNFNDIQHLRRLVHLRALVLDGNPICDEMDYRDYVIALLPDLLILDYVRIKPSDRMSPGVTQFAKQIQAIADVEDGMRRRASVVEANEELQKVYQEAHSDGLDSEEFWSALVEKDTDGDTILQIPGAAEITQTFKELTMKTCHDFFVKAMRAYTMRQNEYHAFNTAVTEVKSEIIKHGRQLTEEFLEFHATSMERMNPVMAQLELRDRMGNGGTESKSGKIPPEYTKLQEQLTTDVLAYIKQLHKLWYVMVSAEVDLNEQIIEAGQELERSLRELVTNWIEQAHGYFGQIRNQHLQLQHQLNEKLTAATSGEHEEEESESDIAEEMETLVEDKDALKAAIQASHDHRLAVIDGKEETLIANMKKWIEMAAAKIRTDEVDRSRRRISEISHFADYHYKILKDAKMLSHCLGVIPQLRDDQDHIPTKQELKERRLKRKQEHEEEEEELTEYTADA